MDFYGSASKSVGLASIYVARRATRMLVIGSLTCPSLDNVPADVQKKRWIVSAETRGLCQRMEEEDTLDRAKWND